MLERGMLQYIQKGMEGGIYEKFNSYLIRIFFFQKILKRVKKMVNCKYNVCYVVLIKRFKEYEVTCVNRIVIDDGEFLFGGGGGG